MGQGWIDQSLPLSGETPIARHCSALGAINAQPRASAQTKRYLRLLAARGDEGLTDWEAADLMGLERSTINARRVPRCKGDDPWIVPEGSRPGPTGIRNTVWKLSALGLAAVAAMAEAT